MNTGDYQFEVISHIAPRDLCYFYGQRKDSSFDTTIMHQRHSKIQSDTQLWRDKISSACIFLFEALSRLLQFSPFFQGGSSYVS